MTFQPPNEFVPQTGQAISSSQMDENFDAVAGAISTLQDAAGAGTGTFTEARKILYTQRPAYVGSGSPAANEFIDRKYLEATRGCRIGDIIFSINPNATPTDYGVVWAKMEGQQLSTTTYADFYTICNTIGGTDTGRYNPATGATAGNFVAPDWRGGVPVQILAGSTSLTDKVPNFVAANWLGSILGESSHIQTIPELVSHKHDQQVPSSDGGGQNYNGTGDGPVTTDTGLTGGGEAFNIVQRCFVSLLWVRIK